MAEEPEVTEEQAESALRDVMGLENPEEVSAESKIIPDERVEQAKEAAVESAPTEAPASTEQPEGPPAEAAETPVPESDDVTSLKQRLEQYETDLKTSEEKFQSRLKAQQDRFKQNEEILRNKHLRKSSALDTARRILEQSQTEGGVPEAEVVRALDTIRGTMNPDSASYAPPPQESAAGYAPQPSGNGREEQALIVNNFLNDRGMDEDEANKFNEWIRTEAEKNMSPGELSVASESLGGFLQLAHSHYRDAMRQKSEDTRSDAVKAIKSVQRTQKQAARAAESRADGPVKPQPATTNREMTAENMTQEDAGRLIRAITDGYT